MGNLKLYQYGLNFFFFNVFFPLGVLRLVVKIMLV
jgi:hypothetical protein